MESLEDKVVVVTGGQSGIGRACSQKFAEHGAKVVMGDIRKRPRAAEIPTADLINQRGGESVFIETDVRNPQSVQKLADRTVEEYGGIDLWFNDAGIANVAPLEDHSFGDIERQIDTNLKGVIYGSKYALEQMREQGQGVILNTASGAATIQPEDHTVYTASKMGVVGFTKSLNKEIDQEDIRVNAVHPGTTRTVLSGFNGGPKSEVADRMARVATLEKSGEELDVGNRDFKAESKREKEK